MRNVPDVALTADNVYVIADNGVQLHGCGRHQLCLSSPWWCGGGAGIYSARQHTILLWEAGRGEESVGYYYLLSSQRWRH